MIRQKKYLSLVNSLVYPFVFVSFAYMLPGVFLVQLYRIDVID